MYKIISENKVIQIKKYSLCLAILLFSIWLSSKSLSCLSNKKVIERAQIIIIYFHVNAYVGI